MKTWIVLDVDAWDSEWHLHVPGCDGTGILCLTCCVSFCATYFSHIGRMAGVRTVWMTLMTRVGPCMERRRDLKERS